MRSQAIDYVCDPNDDLDLLSGLESLLDKSLIQQTEDRDEARYDMLETIRDFADEALLDSGEANQMQRRHLTYFGQLAEEAAPNLVGPDELTWLTRLTGEHNNLQSAILWGLQHDLERAVGLLYDLILFWSRGGHNEEAIGWLRLALSALETSQNRKLRAKALLSLGILAWHDLGLQAALVRQLESLVIVCAALGKFIDAARLCGAAQNLHDQKGPPRLPEETIEYDRALQEIRRAVDPSIFGALFAEGQAMRMSEAVDYAVGPASS